MKLTVCLPTGKEISYNGSPKEIRYAINQFSKFVRTEVYEVKQTDSQIILKIKGEKETCQN